MVASCEHDPSLSSAEQLASIPEFSQLGPLFRSSDKPVELTESETEYVVRCVKHVFSKHMVFQVCSLVCVSAISCTCTVFVVPPDVAQQGPLQDAGSLSSLLSFPCKSISTASLHTLHSCHVPVLWGHRCEAAHSSMWPDLHGRKFQFLTISKLSFHDKQFLVQHKSNLQPLQVWSSLHSLEEWHY